ncbi:MAG: hypothetical protein M1827_007022 [Pycnora praestabilis]|nr:MAG: hypothetical protein M1827_007022 [Pycnora praestabilis]
MQAARRNVVNSSRRVRTSSRKQAPRRKYSTDPGPSTEHAESAAHHTPRGPTHAPEPQNESLGKGFYITLSLLPLSFAIYKFSRSADGSSADAAQPLFTRVINSYSGYKDKWAARNTLHTDMIEQAAFDRNLFQNSRGSGTVDLRFPEIFNTGCPYNVPAGHGGANLDRLIAHYEKKNAEAEEAKISGANKTDGIKPEEMVRRGTY